MPDNDAQAQAIVDEIVDKVTKKFGPDRKFESTSFADWQGELKRHVKKRLDEGLKWEDSKNDVLHVAKEMGRIAEELADGDDEIQEKQMRAAFNCVRFHKRCQAARAGMSPLGAWCDF